MFKYDAGNYDVIVVGAGHAGCEAALAAANMGKKTLVLTLNLEGIALLACNPAIGGTAKGHLVREIDALGGAMGIAADATYLQMKMLNRAKGAAVHSLRAQTDKRAYHIYMKCLLENTENLTVKQSEVAEILTQNGKVSGVVTTLGAQYSCASVVIATGVYLKSDCIVGENRWASGPSGLAGANELSRSLINLGLSIRRFKTGTPARVDGKTVDFSKMQVEEGDMDITPFSFMSARGTREQFPCYLTYTNERTHEIIRENIHRSPLYTGKIAGVGPRYCPSIEDKVMRFADKERHQMFLEPEGADTREMYVQGMSSSLPEDVQIALYRTVAGMEHVEFTRPAYAIEYDCIDPTQLTAELQLKSVEGIFTAGQINGSSGYEEAGAQGIVAGINAVLYVQGKEGIVVGRDGGYVGVLIDDLVTKGTEEPYRMMTSRAEYRLLLRQDNADARLTELGRSVGLVSDERYDIYMKKMEIIAKEQAFLKGTHLAPDEKLTDFLEGFGGSGAKSPKSLADLLRRPEIHYGDLSNICDLSRYDSDTELSIETDIKYEGYIEKQLRQIKSFRELERKLIPADFDYAAIGGLRLEARAKLSQIRPTNLGQASRISGVSPADISVLTVMLKGQ